jgi:hypothetical protein
MDSHDGMISIRMGLVKRNCWGGDRRTLLHG